ncbi:MAG: hypothetical protein JWN98_862, partial [Abditibacteriota bacterium]|nr:hypothetical protein [Abditibacteriota bacterium]
MHPGTDKNILPQTEKTATIVAVFSVCGNM